MENGSAKRNVENGKPEKVEVHVEPLVAAPCEGGVRGWLVVIASFLVNAIVFSIHNSSGVIVKEIESNLKNANDTSSAAKAALVGSLATGMTFFTSAVAGVLIDFLGIKTTALIGGSLATGGMLSARFFTDSVYALYFTFGIMFGVGASLVYTSSLIILGHHFKKSLGVVSGFAAAGSSVFTLFMPHVLSMLLEAIGLSNTFLFLAGLGCVLIGCALVFNPSKEVVKKRQSLGPRDRCKELINTDLFRQRRYLIWTIAMPTALLGYFIIYIQTASFIKTEYEGQDGNVLITCLAAMSLVSRIVCGPVADRVDKVMLQQIAFVLLGILTMLLVAFHNFPLLIFFFLCLGVCDGFCVALIGPIGFELCGKEGASQAIGFVLGLSSIPTALGPFLAGFLVDATNSYTMAYVMSGAITVFGAMIMTFMHCSNVRVFQTGNPPAEVVEFEVTPLQAETHMEDTRPQPPSYKDAVAGKLQNGTSNHVSS